MLIARLESPSVPPIEFQSPRYEGVGPALTTADGHLVAVQRGGVWLRGETTFASIHFLSPVVVKFAHPGLMMAIDFGPPTNARIIDSSLWQEGDQQHLFARFDESLGMWHILAQPAGPMSHCTIGPA